MQVVWAFLKHTAKFHWIRSVHLVSQGTRKGSHLQEKHGSERLLHIKIWQPTAAMQHSKHRHNSGSHQRVSTHTHQSGMPFISSDYPEPHPRPSALAPNKQVKKVIRSQPGKDCKRGTSASRRVSGHRCAEHDPGPFHPTPR